MTHYATFNLSPTHKAFILAYSFAGPCSAYLAWENEEVTSFLVKYRPYSWPRSLLIFCSITLVFVLFNGTKTLFSYNMCYIGLHSRMRKLDTIKNLGNPILNGTKRSRDCTPDVLLQLLRTCILVLNMKLVSVVLDTHIKCVDNTVKGISQHLFCFP